MHVRRSVPSRLTVHRLLLLLLLLWLPSCGGGDAPTGPGPSTPPPPPPPPPSPLPSVTVTFNTNPVVATLIGDAEGNAAYRVQATVTFSETAGTGGNINQLTGVIAKTAGENESGMLQVDIPIGARGTASFIVSQEFTISEPASVKWQISASGLDDSGRAFQSLTGEADVDPPTPQPPSGGQTVVDLARILLGADRLEVRGGVGYQQLLGCFTCSEFDVESFFNQFGLYGSRFSSTSVWNHFSQYGSRFSVDSACNEFATNPPILVNVETLNFVELTLNRFRPSAWSDPAVVDWLQTVVCEL